MPRFSANISMLYPDLPFLDRFAAAALDGFKAVEYVGAYDQDPSELKQVLADNGLVQALFNLPAGNWAAGERGIGCHPDRIKEFRDGIEIAIAYAQATGCLQVNCLAGIAPAGYDRTTLEAVLVDNLRYAAPRLAAVGIKLLLEPINTRDISGFLINSTADYERIAAAVGHENLYLQYDFYHMQLVQGDLLPTLNGCRRALPMCRLPTIPAATSPAPGRSTIRTSSSRWTGPVTPAGWAPSTGHGPAPAKVLIGSSHGESSHERRLRDGANPRSILKWLQNSKNA